MEISMQCERRYLVCMLMSFVVACANEEKINKLKPILKKTSKYISVEEINKGSELAKEKDTLVKAIQIHSNELKEAANESCTSDTIKAKHVAGKNLRNQLLWITQQEVISDEGCRDWADIDEIIECSYHCGCCIPSYCREIPVNRFNQRIVQLVEKDIITLSKQIKALTPQVVEER